MLFTTPNKKRPSYKEGGGADVILMKDISSIVVVGKPVKIKENPTSYKLIGKGLDGAVFQISEEKCVKIYPDPLLREYEEEMFHYVSPSPYFPKFYESNYNYLVMEFIDGITLRKYFKKGESLTRELGKELIGMLVELNRLNLIDTGIQNLILSEDQKIKVVDLLDFVPQKRKKQELRLSRVYAQKYITLSSGGEIIISDRPKEPSKKPSTFLQGLKDYDLLENFLMYVREENKKLYNLLI